VNRNSQKMHPLVRDLYKRVLHAGKDYPTGLEHVKNVWKEALRNPRNCPACYGRALDTDFCSDSLRGQSLRMTRNNVLSLTQPANRSGVVSSDCEREIRAAVARGRYMVKEMVGVSQLKKYRSMLKRYGADGKMRSYGDSLRANGADQDSQMAINKLEESAHERFLR
jgi:hypothetical protein